MTKEEKKDMASRRKLRWTRHESPLTIVFLMLLGQAAIRFMIDLVSLAIHFSIDKLVNSLVRLVFEAVVYSLLAIVAILIRSRKRKRSAQN
ncbi:hypothetical protein [Streptomyces sp. NPDC058398]|uniref:hypothetical protein n=1 Tax=Streptomyces sp. NPDC058398 TaxID=3346479 RepID=UPI003655AE20